MYPTISGFIFAANAMLCFHLMHRSFSTFMKSSSFFPSKQSPKNH